MYEPNNLQSGSMVDSRICSGLCCHAGLPWQAVGPTLCTACSMPYKSPSDAAWKHWPGPAGASILSDNSGTAKHVDVHS